MTQQGDKYRILPYTSISVINLGIKDGVNPVIASLGHDRASIMLDQVIYHTALLVGIIAS